MRFFEGVNLTPIRDLATFDGFRVVDNFLRDVGPAIKALQTAIGSGGGGGGASPNASYITAVTEAGLPQSRLLSVSAPLTKSDGGGGSSLSLGLNIGALAATPTITFGTSYGPGAASTFVRSDAQLKYPTSLLSALSGATATFTDNATDSTLTSSLGIFNINAAAGMALNIGPTTATAGLTLLTDATTSPQVTALVNIRPAAGSRFGLRSQFFSGDLTTTSVGAWDAVVNPSGVFTGATISAFASTTCSLAPSVGSDNANKFYGINLGTQFRIANANAGFSEVATAYFKGVTRLIGSSTITVQAGVIIEPPTAATSDQFGLLIRQQTAQATATNRTGIRIDSQNSGTNRLSIDANDRVKIVNPLGIAANVLELSQQNTGAVAGAHVNFNNKSGDPPSPSVGDLWRNGSSFNYRKDSTTTIDLANPASAPGSMLTHQAEIDFGTTPVDDASIIILDGSVVLGSKIVVGLAYEQPTGKDVDEIGMDAILFTAGQATAGQFILYARGLEGYLHDKFLINYTIG